MGAEAVVGRGVGEERQFSSVKNNYSIVCQRCLALRDEISLFTYYSAGLFWPKPYMLVNKSRSL